MPNSPVVPTVRRRRLGMALRKCRTQAGFTLDDAADKMGWKGPKLSKIENAGQSIQPADVGRLLRTYGVEDAETLHALESLARDAGKRGWWHSYGGLVSASYADYISLESDALRICEWSPLLIPGLLQTAAYARSSIMGINTARSLDEATALAEIRQARQSVLSRSPKPLELHAIIHEAVLHQEFAGSPATMRGQLRRLVEMAELPNVTVQVLPMARPAHPGSLGNFSVVSFPRPMPDVILLENLAGATYVEDDDRTTAFTRAFEQIRGTAVSPDESIALISRMAEGSAK